MRFLIDAQLPMYLAEQLTQSGFNAFHVRDYLPATAADGAIAELANALQACVMTKDADFVQFVDRRLLTETLVWIRVRNASNELLWARVSMSLPEVVAAVERRAPVVEVW